MLTQATGRRDNFYYLFVALLVLIVIGPVLTELLGNLGVLIAEIWLSVALVIALWSLRSSRIAERSDNFFVEPQFSVADRGPGQPEWQIYFALNMQFKD